VNDPLSTLAAKALDHVPNGSRIGLGSGHAAEAFIRALGARIQQGLTVRGVPTSEATARLAQALGIPLDPLDDQLLAITIDGADEVDPKTLSVIKGWGGALTRERIVAAASREQILLVTPEKLVDRLGARGKLPVDVVPFAAPFVRRQIERIPLPGGIHPVLRQHEGKPVLTDDGNWIFDCRIPPLDNPHALETALRAIPGVVDTGLFLGTASRVLVAEEGGVRELLRPTV
jgi:ribose 5-phosphate isomerase A